MTRLLKACVVLASVGVCWAALAGQAGAAFMVSGRDYKAKGNSAPGLAREGGPLRRNGLLLTGESNLVSILEILQPRPEAFKAEVSDLFRDEGLALGRSHLRLPPLGVDFPGLGQFSLVSRELWALASILALLDRMIVDSRWHVGHTHFAEDIRHHHRDHHKSHQHGPVSADPSGGSAGPAAVSVVPEPSSMITLGIGLAGLAGAVWRSRRTSRKVQG